MSRKFWNVPVLVLLLSAFAVGQPQNGKLQIHHIDQGQADAAVLISPGGEVVLFDMGADLKLQECQSVIEYLDQLGIRQIDYLFVSHYDYDHIACVPDVLQKFPLMKDAYDRGHDHQGTTYDSYVASLGNHRKEGKVGTTVELDQGSANPVTLTVIAVNGDSKHAHVQTSNENDLSLGVLISFGPFVEEVSGDPGGRKDDHHQDVETPLAHEVGEIDVYKVHHHCSSYSTNATWLAETKPTVAVISTGDTNGYGHPAADCLARLHNSGVQRVYWTERGAGGTPDPAFDVISGDVIIEVVPGTNIYTVTHQGAVPDSYLTKSNVNSPSGIPQAPSKFAWSKHSTLYHDANCPDVKRILKKNLVQGDTPPADKKPAACIKESPLTKMY